MNDAPDLVIEILSRLEQKKKASAAHLGIELPKEQTICLSPPRTRHLLDD